MKQKEKSTKKTPKPLITDIEFITALSADICLQRLIASNRKQVFTNKSIEVVTIDHHFTISVWGLQATIKTTDPLNQRTQREALCIGDLKSDAQGTHVVAKAEFYANYTVSPPQPQKLLAAIFAISGWMFLLVEFVIWATFAFPLGDFVLPLFAVQGIFFSIQAIPFLLKARHTQTPPPPDFAGWLYALLFELEAAPNTPLGQKTSVTGEMSPDQPAREVVE